MRRRMKFSLKSAVAILAVVALMLGVFTIAQASKVSTLENQISAGYERAFYDAMRLMDNIEVGLEKLAVTADRAQQQELLSRISRQSDVVLGDLAVLPLSVDSVSRALKFVNQLGDFSRTLGDRLAEGGQITEEDYLTIDSLAGHCIYLNERFDAVAAEFESGNNVFLSAMGESGSAMDTQDSAVELGDVTAEYPVLLYDGPFSDGRHDDALMSLPGEEIDAGRAQEIAREFIGADRVKSIIYTGDSYIPAQCFEFEAETPDGTLSIAVTRQGGHVLYMMAYSQASDVVYSVEECVEIASGFLSKLGHGAMQVSYWQQAGGLITINMAAEQDGVVLYPDLIKVQISMQSGNVVGYEARNYLANHRERDILSPALSESEARAKLSSRLTVDSFRLCVIPLELGEAYCYEFGATLDEVRFLIYIDANTGAEQSMLKVIDDPNGQLAI